MSTVAPGLYQRLLAGSWPRLHELVRRFHDGTVIVRAQGPFQIRRGSNWLCRLLAWLARLPPAGANVDTQLSVVPRDQGEEWQRAFAGRALVSKQWERTDGTLGEIFGRREIRMRLEVVDGALHYEATGAALRLLGPLRLPLLGWLRPRVRASETAVGPDRLHVVVEMSLPLLGRLISYEGIVTISV